MPKFLDCEYDPTDVKYDFMPALPADYEEGVLLKKALRKRNQTLAAEGKRICEDHQGHALPLDEAHFYRNGFGGYYYICIKCKNRRTMERAKERYHTDKSFVKARQQHQRTDRERHLEARRESNARNMRNWRQRRKAARFASVLGERAS